MHDAVWPVLLKSAGCWLLLQAQGLIRRGARLTEKQQKQERICVRFYGALVLQGEGTWLRDTPTNRPAPFLKPGWFLDFGCYSQP